MAKAMTRTKWTIDSDHSAVSFGIKYLMLANVRGLINKVAGAVYFDPPDVVNMDVDVEMDVSSLTTGVSKRDEHLKKEDFFAAARYPKITFKSTKAESLGDRHIRITGDLTLHGVTHQVVIEGEYNGPVKLPEAIGGETSLGFTGSTMINREDFGMKWGSTPMEGGLMLDREVLITLDIETDMAGQQ